MRHSRSSENVHTDMPTAKVTSVTGCLPASVGRCVLRHPLFYAVATQFEVRNDVLILQYAADTSE